MSAVQIIDDLTRLGVELWADESQLRFRAPASILTDAHKGALLAHKAEILALLEKERPGSIVHDPAGRYEPFPLTDVQTAYLLGRQESLTYGGVACHGYLEITWPALTADTLEDAWNHLVRRHEMLRAVIEQDGYQRVLPDVPGIRIESVDLRDATPAAIESHLDAIREAMGHRIYDTTTWPLFELRHTRTPAGDIVHFSLDALIADWASAGILFDELDLVLSGRTAELAPLAISFREYLLAERQWRDTARYRDDRRYWIDRVDTLPPAPRLPLRQGPSPRGPARFHRHSLHLSSKRWDTFRASAVTHGVTPTALLLTAYTNVIRRWSQQQAFSLSLTLLNRMPIHPQVDRLVGDFTSVGILQIENAAGDIASQARAIGEQLFADLDHRLFSGVEMVREIARRHGREAALMPVVFTGAIGTQSIDAPASGRKPGYGITQTPQVLLDCQVGDGPDGLSIHWDVRQHVFPDGMVEDMFAAFKNMVEHLADDADAGHQPCDIALPAWQREERDAVNATTAPCDARLLYADILAQAGRLPDKGAVIDAHGSLTYRQLITRANGLAHALRDRGLVAGECVAVAIDKSCEQVIAVLGVLLAGGAYVPIDPSQPRLRRERIVGQADIRFAIARNADAIGEWPATLDWLSTQDIAGSALPPAPITTPDTVAYVIFTSGSTGEPKGVMISHRAAMNTIDDMGRRFGINEDDRMLGLAQLGFDLSVYDIFGPLGRGGTLVLPDPARGADPSHWAERVAVENVTLWNSVPAQMQMLVDYLDSDPRALPSLRQAWLSGDWIPLNLPKQAHQHLPGLRIVGLGGATEASIWSNHHCIEAVEPHWTSIPYGVPLANQSFRVLDDRMQDVPVWVPGELYIGGAGLAQGYLGDPALTDTRFIRHPADGERLYRTGDLARYLPGGALEFLGREDDQIKLRGHRIELGEIEAALWSYPGVSGAAAVVAEGDGGERSLLAFVETARRSIDRSADPVPDLGGVLKHADKSGFSSAHATYMRDLHNAAHCTMLHTLWRRGAWHDGRSAGADAILDDAKVHARHRWLIRRWLEGMHAAGRLKRDDHDRYRPSAFPDAATVTEAWQRVMSGTTEARVPLAVINYLRLHATHLDALLDDRCNPFELLFPQGTDDLALALYGEEPASQYNNQALAAVLRQIAAWREDGSPLRILEIGAGTGATTAVIAPMLDGLEVDYLFTDQSTFFLPDARRRHATYPWIRHGLLDVDRDPREQGIAPSSFDVVVCAGVLSSVHDTDASLRRIGEMLAPDGWLLFTEPTVDHPHILLSQGFMMSPAGGDRDHGASPFLSVSRWEDAIRGSGGEPVLHLPQDDHPLAPGHMRLFAARYKRDRVPLCTTALQNHLAGRLPAHMLPAQLQIVDQLPLTANGKLDRKALTTWRVRHGASDLVEEPVESDPLERQLCALWADALGIPALGRNDNVYDHGADSLILARAAGRVRDEVPGADAYAYDTVLRRMLNEPTVAALARLLRDGDATDTTVTKPAVQTGAREGSNALLVPFGGGEGVTRVMFHAALGTLDYFQHLGKTLAAQQKGPVIGIAVANTERYLAIDPRALIQTLADDYAQRLIDEGHTRFQLVGYCLGGLLATEVARRLLERGLDIVDLSLVDSIPMFIDTDEELAFEAIFVPNLNLDPVKAVFGPDVNDADVYRAIERLMTDHDRRVPAGAMAALQGDAGLEAVAKAAKQRARLSQDERLASYAAAAASQAGLPISPELVPALFRVCRHSMRAARFDPPPFVGDITFLRCQEQQSFGVTGGVGHLAAPFWEDTCLGEFHLIDVPGNHFSVIEPPHVSVVTTHLLNALGKRT